MALLCPGIVVERIIEDSNLRCSYIPSQCHRAHRRMTDGTSWLALKSVDAETMNLSTCSS